MTKEDVIRVKNSAVDCGNGIKLLVDVVVLGLRVYNSKVRVAHLTGLSCCSSSEVAFASSLLYQSLMLDLFNRFENDYQKVVDYFGDSLIQVSVISKMCGDSFDLGDFKQFDDKGGLSLIEIVEIVLKSLDSKEGGLVDFLIGLREFLTHEI